MSITDELREWINGNTIIHVTELRAIADRIDEEHERTFRNLTDALHKQENAKLREQLAEWKRVAESKQNIIDHMRDANAENAKLREQLDVAEHNQTRNAREYARLCHENDKLRELVQDIYEVMWACAEQRCTHRHDGCFRVRGNHGDICVSERCWYEDRMSELGIEV